MKTNIVKFLSFVLVPCSLLLSSCKDYLTEIEPGTTLLGDFYTSTDAAVQNVTGLISRIYCYLEKSKEQQRVHTCVQVRAHACMSYADTEITVKFQAHTYFYRKKEMKGKPGKHDTPATSQEPPSTM